MIWSGTTVNIVRILTQLHSLLLVMSVGLLELLVMYQYGSGVNTNTLAGITAASTPQSVSANLRDR
jgi:hypothetical protein